MNYKQLGELSLLMILISFIVLSIYTVYLLHKYSEDKKFHRWFLLAPIIVFAIFTIVIIGLFSGVGEGIELLDVLSDMKTSEKVICSILGLMFFVGVIMFFIVCVKIKEITG